LELVLQLLRQVLLGLLEQVEQQVQLVPLSQLVLIEREQPEREQPERVLLALELHLHFEQHPCDAQVFQCGQVIQLRSCRWKEQAPSHT
jgi:hypothetical protein